MISNSGEIFISRISTGSKKWFSSTGWRIEYISIFNPLWRIGGWSHQSDWLQCGVVLWKQSIDQQLVGRHRNSGSSIRWFVVYKRLSIATLGLSSSMVSQCLALPHILWVCLFQWEIPIYDDLWQFQWGTSDSRSGSGGNLEPSRTWKKMGWTPWFPMDFPMDFPPFKGDQTHQKHSFRQVLRLRSQLSEMQAKGLAWYMGHGFIHGFHSYPLVMSK
jgi:hypothetical protein